MFIDSHPNGTIKVNLRTGPSNGATSVWHAEDEGTQTYHGGLHSQVLFKDVKLEVTMDSNDDVDWRDLKAAREAAWKALMARLRPCDLGTILKKAESIGCNRGSAAAQKKIRQALGVFSNSDRED